MALTKTLAAATVFLISRPSLNRQAKMHTNVYMTCKSNNIFFDKCVDSNWCKHFRIENYTLSWFLNPFKFQWLAVSFYYLNWAASIVLSKKIKNCRLVNPYVCWFVSSCNIFLFWEKIGYFILQEKLTILGVSISYHWKAIYDVKQ